MLHVSGQIMVGVYPKGACEAIFRSIQRRGKQHAYMSSFCDGKYYFMLQGGQNVNKLNTKVELRFNLDQVGQTLTQHVGICNPLQLIATGHNATAHQSQATWMPADVSRRLRSMYNKHCSKEGDFIVTSEKHRTYVRCPSALPHTRPLCFTTHHTCAASMPTSKTPFPSWSGCCSGQPSPPKAASSGRGWPKAPSKRASTTRKNALKSSPGEEAVVMIDC